jgi:transcriptional regulator with XRE-family HTH domain
MDLFATNLRKRAEELGITNAEVARRAGLSERRYGNYVSGRREPDLATLVKIAAVLATTPNDLLSVKWRSMTRENQALQRIIAALSVLPPDDVDRVAIMIEALAKTKP